MKKYNVQYSIEGCSYGEPLNDYVILSEHYFFNYCIVDSL